MPAFSGTFSGTIEVQSGAIVGDNAGHELSLALVRGPQQCSDDKWNGATITYTAVLDLTDGKGTQRGYFVNLHVDGDSDYGMFDGVVASVGDEIVCQGTWESTGGTGRYRGITGKGKFRMVMPTPKTVRTTWDGAYELASAKAHAS